MVSCKLYGGNCNQLFQIATTIAYAKRHNLEYFIPSETEDESKWPHGFRGMFPEIDKADRPKNVRKEASNGACTYFPHYYSVTLDGYFQDERYFKEYREDILKLLKLEYIPYYKDYVSIHVRRGDYLNFPDKHPVVTEEYLIEAIKCFISNKSLHKFVVVSDDIEWCKTIFRSSRHDFLKSVTIKFSENDAKDDLLIMVSCSNHIISNSSFSWWGAWLSYNPHKIVIAPKVWTNVAENIWDTRDICPKDWIRL